MWLKNKSLWCVTSGDRAMCVYIKVLVLCLNIINMVKVFFHEMFKV